MRYAPRGRPACQGRRDPVPGQMHLFVVPAFKLGRLGRHEAGGFSPQPFAEVLPGDNQCGAEDVPWLSEGQTTFTVAPGQSVTVAVTADSSAVSQPGGYAAQLLVNTNTPYQVQPVSVTCR
jgi:hypothetical protein